MTSLLSVAEAQARLLALASPVASERISLHAAAGRWAAEDVHSRRTQPAADLSSMDGYAIRFADLPGPFRLVGESAAGRPHAGGIGAAETARIFTGAIMPAGADTVLVQEEAEDRAGTIHLTGEGPPRLGSSVRRRGLDFTEGGVLITKGERITPARAALAGLGGHAELAVRRPIRVAIAATGDELVPHGAPLRDGQVHEVNALMLATMLADLPVTVVPLGILPDLLDVLTAAFAAVDADVLVTTGGASVGDHDLVRPALETVGAHIDFWKVALRPGRPIMAGRLKDAVVLGLPGNPVSAFVTATLFLRPLVVALSGAADPFPRTRTVPLGEPLPANDSRADYLRAELRDGHAHASSIQDSSMLRTLARATCLIVRPPHAPAAAEGDSAEILDLA
ncbi:molybdopterin molybdotransferase MoeA [Sphingomonas sp. DT-204]|uniref:molybdopterin molybdotransferase MoeA n=1 Tax=Sphingomonas sp. DT-204 TaxID=3396166 RepID=UPI003F1BF498